MCICTFRYSLKAIEMEGGKNTDRRKSRVNFSKEEILLLLRSFQASPYNWDDIIALMKENLHHLGDRAQELYMDAPPEHLKERCQLKLRRLLSSSDGSGMSVDVRLELQRVKVVEAEASQVPQSQIRSQSTAKISSEKSEQTEGERDSQIDSVAGFFVSETAPLWTAASQSTEITKTKKRKRVDPREEILDNLTSASDEEGTKEKKKKKKKQKKEKKKKQKKKNKKKKHSKKSTVELSRENNLKYAHLLDKCFPKLLQIIGVSSSSDTSSSDDDD